MAIVQITGGPTGIGRATALAFANEGDQIVAMATRAELAQETARARRRGRAHLRQRPP
jgi:NAD(P)-dependent dehydrogenase (short-subunit alcohol dehydrogenase family)